MASSIWRMAWRKIALLAALAFCAFGFFSYRGKMSVEIAQLQIRLQISMNNAESLATQLKVINDHKEKIEELLKSERRLCENHLKEKETLRKNIQQLENEFNQTKVGFTECLRQIELMNTVDSSTHPKLTQYADTVGANPIKNLTTVDANLRNKNQQLYGIYDTGNTLYSNKDRKQQNQQQPEESKLKQQLHPQLHQNDQQIQSQQQQQQKEKQQQQHEKQLQPQIQKQSNQQQQQPQQPQLEEPPGEAPPWRAEPPHENYVIGNSVHFQRKEPAHKNVEFQRNGASRDEPSPLGDVKKNNGPTQGKELMEAKSEAHPVIPQPEFRGEEKDAPDTVAAMEKAGDMVSKKKNGRVENLVDATPKRVKKKRRRKDARENEDEDDANVMDFRHDDTPDEKNLADYKEMPI